jgi:hypothetical protein
LRLGAHLPDNLEPFDHSGKCESRDQCGEEDLHDFQGHGYPSGVSRIADGDQQARACRSPVDSGSVFQVGLPVGVSRTWLALE